MAQLLQHGTDLPRRIDVIPFTPAALETGTWANGQGSAEVLGAARFNSTQAQNDEIGYDLILAAGTWRIDLIVTKTTAGGIASVRVDDVEVGTVDTYNGSTTRNNAASVTGITVATTGLHRVSLKAATKNASSSAYIIAFNMLTLRKTA